MRGISLTLIAGGVLACAAPPGTATVERSEEERGDVQPPPATRIEPEPVPAREADPLLARARAGVRGGRVSEALRRELVASRDPDHRHAARLLQAIAGEDPAEVLARSKERSSAPELASAAELFEPGADAVQPAPAIAVEAEPEPPAESAESAEIEPIEQDEPVEPPPKLSSFPPESPARWWFESGLPEAETETEPATEPPPGDPNPSLETIVGPLPLLLRERPPLAEPPEPSGDGPRLVILTSLSARSTAEGTSLELAGAGSVRVAAQPLQNGRVRLWMLDAGAVPGFLSARPTAPGLEVVDVARRDRRLEIEVELGHGWTLLGATTLENGASVEFGEAPSAASPERLDTPG